MSQNMVFAATMSMYQIGTRLRLENDYPSDSHEVYGYTNNADGAYIEFLDGSRLNLAHIDQIREVL